MIQLRAVSKRCASIAASAEPHDAIAQVAQALLNRNVAGFKPLRVAQVELGAVLWRSDEAILCDSLTCEIEQAGDLLCAGARIDRLLCRSDLRGLALALLRLLQQILCPAAGCRRLPTVVPAVPAVPGDPSRVRIQECQASMVGADPPR